MAQRILGIDIGATEVEAVLAEVSWRDIQILGTYVETVPSAEAVAHRLPPNEPDFPKVDDGETEAEEEDSKVSATVHPTTPPPPWVFALADLIGKHNLDYQEVYVAFPGIHATTHLITLPFENRRRIEQVLSYELENLVPYDLDDMHISFDILGKAPEGGSRVLVCITPKDRMKTLLGQLAQAGIDPKVVDVMPFTLFTAARLVMPEEMGAYAIVDIGHTHTEMALLNEGQLVDLRSIPLGGEQFTQQIADAMKISFEQAQKLKEEKAVLQADDQVGHALQSAMQPLLMRLRQTLRGVRSSQGLDITRIYLTGRGSLLNGLSQMLSDELGVNIERFNPLAVGQVVGVADPNNHVDQARFAYAMTLPHRGIGPLRDIQMNMRGGEFFYQRQRVAFKASLRSIATIGVVILLLLAYNVVSSHIQKKRYYEAISDQVVQIYLKAFPGAPPAQPLEQFRGQVSKTMAKYETVGFFGEGDLRAIDILKLLSESIPPTMKVDFNKLDLSGDTVKIEGTCAEFSDVDKIEESLLKFPAFKHIKKESSKSVSNEVKFKFTISLVETKPATGAAAGAAGQRATTPAVKRLK